MSAKTTNYDRELTFGITPTVGLVWYIPERYTVLEGMLYHRPKIPLHKVLSSSRPGFNITENIRQEPSVCRSEGSQREPVL